MSEEMDVMTWGRERDGWALIAPAMGVSARARASMAINARPPLSLLLKNCHPFRPAYIDVMGIRTLRPIKKGKTIMMPGESYFNRMGQSLSSSFFPHFK